MKHFTIKVTKKEIMETAKEENYSFSDEQIQECMEKLENSTLEFVGNEIRSIFWNMSNNQ
jgi:PP-loop superfamily ATP-utilizing enzyme